MFLKIVVKAAARPTKLRGYRLDSFPSEMGKAVLQERFFYSLIGSLP